ncbi:MAG: flagellin FliC [Bacteriovoracaceae bacterium]|nr:flagellin FliC [Bacteriovoracaceae bacterium]
MGLRINTNIASQEAQRNLRVNSAEQETEFARLSSGKRITKSADDAAGLAIAKKLEASNRGVKMATRNANDAISVVQVAEGGLNESSNILTRLRELSIQAASDTVGEQERGYLNLEYQQLTQELDRIAVTTTYNNMPLLKGDAGGGVLDFQVGAYGGEENRIQFDASQTDATIENLGIDGTSVVDKGDAAGNLEKIDRALDKVNGFRANLGSMQSRLQSSISNLESTYVNQEAARSRIEDTDVADSSAKLASINIMKAAGTAVLSQANDLPASALKLVA